MENHWHNHTDTNSAAAFATLGATVQIQTALIQRTSTRNVRFLISTKSADGLYNIGKLRKAIRDKTLPTTLPAHPVCTILRAYMNREARLDIQKRGTFYRLVAVANSPGVHQYVPSETGLPGVTGQPAIVRTQDAILSDALATAGHPLLRLTGSGDHHEYTHAAAALGSMTPTAHLLIEAWRADPINYPLTTPFGIAAQGLRVRAQLLNAVKDSIDSIIISKPRTTAHAIIRADATNEAWDKARTFLTGIS